MAITLDGPNQLIVLDTATTFTVQSIYDACIVWAVQAGNMQFLLPMASAGKAPLGGGIFTDLIFKLVNGWKLKPSGYAADTQVKLTGTLITDDSSLPTVPPTSGSPVQWLIQATTAATIITVSGGSGLSSAEHDYLMSLPLASGNAAAVWAKTLEGTLTAEQAQRLLLSVLTGKVSGAGTGTEVFRDLADSKNRVTFTTDANGNRTAVVRDVT